MLKALTVLSIVISLMACANFSPYGGLSAHSKELDRPEVQLSTGLGFFGAEYTQENWGDVHLFCEHLSGLSTSELGGGLNHCGVILR